MHRHQGGLFFPDQKRRRICVDIPGMMKKKRQKGSRGVEKKKKNNLFEKKHQHDGKKEADRKK